MTRWSGHNIGIILDMSLAPKIRREVALGRTLLFLVHAIVNGLLETGSRGHTAQCADGAVALSA